MNDSRPIRVPLTSRRLGRTGLGAGILFAFAATLHAPDAGAQRRFAMRRSPAPTARPAQQAQARQRENFAGRNSAGNEAVRPKEATPNYAGSNAQAQPQRGYAGQGMGSGQPNRPLIQPNRPRQNQQHLGAWMNQHSNMSLDQQQRALEQEPGFRQLPPEQQQRMRDRLTQLNRMSPQQRQSVIDRTEAMERLTPQQRQQVRSAAGELGSLPPDRRRAVAQAFRGLQSMPADQRQNYMDSPQFRSQYNDEERNTLNHLMQVSPYLPMRQPGGAPQ